MNKKLILVILIIIVVVISAIVAINAFKQDTSLNVYCESIPNSTDEYLIVELLDSNDNIVDDYYGTVSIELQDKYDCLGVIYDSEPLEDGKSIIRIPKDYYIVHVNYGGSLFYNPCNLSLDLQVSSVLTNYTDDDLTSDFMNVNLYGNNSDLQNYLYENK